MLARIDQPAKLASSRSGRGWHGFSAQPALYFVQTPRSPRPVALVSPVLGQSDSCEDSWPVGGAAVGLQAVRSLRQIRRNSSRAGWVGGRIKRRLLQFTVGLM